MSDLDLAVIAAEAAGLPAEFAERLHGDTPEELAADAEAFADALGLKPPKAAFEQWRDLAQSDPERFCQLTEGDVDLSEPPPANGAPETETGRLQTHAEALSSREALRREIHGGTRDALRELARTNPAEFNRRLDCGEITEEMMRR